MFSGVYDHSVVIAFAAVRAMSSFVSTSARSASTGCTIAPTNAPPATNNTAAAAAAIFSRLPAGRCGTRTGSVSADSRFPRPPRVLSLLRPASSSLVCLGFIVMPWRLRSCSPASSGAGASSAVVGATSAGSSIATCSVAAVRSRPSRPILPAPQEVPPTTWSSAARSRLFGSRRRQLDRRRLRRLVGGGVRRLSAVRPAARPAPSSGRAFLSARHPMPAPGLAFLGRGSVRGQIT